MRDVPQQILRLPIISLWSTAGIYQTPRLKPIQAPRRYELVINLKTAKCSASMCRPCCSLALIA